MIIVNNSILYTSKLPRDQILNVLTAKKKTTKKETMRCDAHVSNTTAVIVLQYINVSDQHVVYLELTQ